MMDFCMMNIYEVKSVSVKTLWDEGAGAAATNNSDIIGMAVAACVGFVLLSVVIGIAVVYFFWTSWFKRLMNQKGKVKMPRSYFQKKKEANRKLLSNSPQQPQVYEVNGNLPPENVVKDAVITNVPIKAASPYAPNGKHIPSENGHYEYITMKKLVSKTQSSTTVVSDWHNGTPIFVNRIYEEKNATMELGEEIDDEFKIETEVVDNEVLDVGPFKNDHSEDVPIKGNVYSDPYIYSAVDRSAKTSHKIAGSSVKPTTANVTTTRTSAKEANSLDRDYASVGEMKTSKF